MPIKIQHRRDTASDWTAANPIPFDGELCFETDTGKLKMGDGVTSWTSLSYVDTDTQNTYTVGDGGLTTNDFTNADHTKLDGIETGADVTDTDNVVAALTAGNNITIAGDGTIDATAGSSYDDSALVAAIALNTAKVSNVDHPLVETAVPSGAVFTDTVFDDSTLTTAVALNTAKVSNVDHPLVETAVPVGAVFTDTVFDDSTLTTAVALNTAKVSNVDHPLVETAVPVGALFTDTNTTYSVQDGELSQNNFTNADHTKLNNIESNATADMTGAEIKAAYELEANAFTDADHTKLDGIEAAADVTDTDNVVAAISAGANVSISALGVISATPPSGTVNMTGAQIKAVYELEASAFTDGQFTKLSNIESNATADQTDAEIKTAYENNADTNAFTDADHTKLDGIASGATVDQTGAEIKAAYEGESDTNVFDDAAVTKLSGIESNATADQTGSEIKTKYENQSDTNAFTDAEKTKLGGIEDSADVTDTTNVVAALSAGTGIGISAGGEISVTSVALTTVQTAANQSAHLALTAQEGDIVVRSDENKTYVHNGGSAGTMADYTLLATPTDAVLSVDGNTGAITAAQIKSAYEGETSAFTDAQFTKLSNIEANATADQTGAQIKTAYEGEADTNAFTDSDVTKLSGIESNATADQTGAEIKTAYEGQSDTNVFDDAAVTKLTGIEASADVTDATNVEAAGALMDSELSDVAGVKALTGTNTGDQTISLTGDVTGSGTGSFATSIANDAVTVDHLNLISTSSVPSIEARSDGSTDGYIQLNCTANSHGIKLKSPPHSAGATYTLTFPDDAGSSDQKLTTDGLGNLTWTDDSATDTTKLPLGGGEMTGNITMSSTETVDGRDLSVDGAKLDLIEASATADQTGAEIKSLYEAEASAFTDALYTKLDGIETSATIDQTGAEIKALYEAEANAFTDTLYTKLDGIEASATADQTGAEIKALYEAEANAFTDADHTKLDGIETSATADQTGAEIKAAYEAEADTNAFTDAEKSALAAIEASATADQTGSEIKTAYEAEADTNAFTDAEKTLLGTVETNADVTDATNVASAGALMDSEVTNLADVKAFDTTDYATAAQGTTADAALPKAGGTMTGNLTVEGITETVTTSGAGFTPVLADGTVFILSAAGTVTMPTAVAGKSFTVVVNTGTHVTWGGSISWNGGAEPAKSGGIDTYVFVCANGSTWLGAQSGTGYA